MNKSKVAVYGTLKSGHGNSPALEHSVMLGAAVVSGSYTMYDMGCGYPAVVVPRVKTQQRVYVEVYEVDEDTLHCLDLIEGHPEFYKREKVSTPYGNAWMYFLPESYASSGTEKVVSGCWKPLPVEREFFDISEASYGKITG